MQRRILMHRAAVLLTLGTLAPLQWARALTLDNLSNADATQGIKGALGKAALSAVSTLGVQDGFMGNDRVRIGLPGHLNDAAKLLRTLGQGDQVDALVLALNRAAESAVPLAKDLLAGAIKNMTVNDAKSILTGGDTAITDFFAAKTRPSLTEKFLPVVSKATERFGLVDKYNQVAGKAAEYGLVAKDEANVQQYVTGKSLDGLYLIISDEEKKIRQDPVAAGSALLSKVFGALR